MRDLQPRSFTFDDTPAFDGFALGTTWNGFDDVAVTLSVRELIASYFRSLGDNDTADDLMSIAPDHNGLVSLAGGYTTRIL
jgi:hypothetical protein